MFLLRIKMYGAGRDSSVGIATGYGLDGPGIESIRLAPTDLCPKCNVTDSLSHRLIECGHGTQHWEWTKCRLVLMLRTDRRWIPADWLLRPQFRFWPPSRHRAVSWTLATITEFRCQQGTLLTTCDLHDFFQRAKRKLYQSHNRVRLVGNYLDVLDF
jgi:hypothetical protein